MKTILWLVGLLFIGMQTASAQPICSVEILQKQDPNQPGTVFLAAIGKGEAPIKYLWSTGDTTQRISVNQPGQYCVTISDAIGCTARNCIDVDSVGGACSVDITKLQGGVGTNIRGTVLIAEAKGVPGFQYEWSTGETTQRIQVDSSGTYCVTVTDSVGCMATACIRLEVPQNDICDVAIRRIDLRIPGTNGILLLADAKGMEPFTFQWSNGATGRALLVNTSGEYCVTMTDAKGCTAKACIQITVNPPQSCDVQIIERQIPGPLGGTLLVAMPRGIPPFQFKWSTGVLNRVLFVNRPGEYCVTMVDGTGCEAKACIRIGNPQNDSCAVEIVQRPSPTAAGGNFVLKANAKGEAPFKYSWSTGDTTEIIRVPGPGKYCVKVIDANGCIATACIEIPDTNCAVRITAKRDSTASGLIVYLTANAKGTPGFLYEWSNGATTQTIRVDKEGQYCVKVTDSTGCMAKACFDLKIGGLHDSCEVKIGLKRTTTNAGVILFAEATGKGPFKYKWSNGETTQEIVVSQIGKYCVEVYSADGCIARACVNWDGRVITPALTGGGTTADFTVYPNPAYDRLVLQRQEFAETSLVRVLRRDGQLVLQSEWPDKSLEWELDVQGLMPGTYFVQTINRNEVITKTFFKQ